MSNHNDHKKQINYLLTQQDYVIALNQFAFMYQAVKKLPQFQGSNLQKIQLIGNALEDASSLQKHQYLNLKQYKVQKHKRLETISLLYAPNIEKINISENKNHYIENIYYLKQGLYKYLQQLIIKGSRRQVIQLGYLQQLTYLDLSQNNLLIMEDILEACPKLVNLNLSSNKITKITQLPTQNLKQVNFSKNCLKDITQTFSGLFPELIDINLSQNVIQNLPLIKIPKLNKFQCNKNLLVNVQDFFSSPHQQLQTVQLIENRIEIFPSIQTPNLLHLNLSVNRLKQIKHSNLPSLLELRLNNPSQNGPAIKISLDIPSVELIELTHNHIEIIPFQNIPQIKILRLNHNKIASIDNFAQKSYTKLQILNLQSNQITHVPALKAPTLQQFNIYYNQITRINSFFEFAYPNLKQFQFQMPRQSEEVNYPKQIVPKINAPLLQWLQVKIFNHKIAQQFFKQQFPFLKTLKIQNMKISEYLPQLYMPLIEQLYINCYISIQQFCQGQYPNLKLMIIYDKPILIHVFSPQNSAYQFQQLIISPLPNSVNKYKIIKLPKIKTQFINNQIRTKWFPYEIKIDVSVILSSQFISQINFTNVKFLQFTHNNFSPTMKNLSKINLNKYKSIQKITINQNDELNSSQIKFPQINNYLKISFDRYENQWRRAYVSTKSVYQSHRICWKINFFNRSSYHQNCNESVTSFQSKLIARSWRLKKDRSYSMNSWSWNQ